MIVKSKTRLRFFSAVFFLILLFVLGVVAFFCREHSLKADVFAHYVVTDSRENGFSEASLSGDSSYTLAFRLRSGAVSPYAGVSYRVQTPEQNLNGTFFDFSRFDSVRVFLRAGRMPHATIRLAVSDPRLTRPELAYSARPAEKIVDVSPFFKEVKIALADLKVPERWFSQMGLDSPDPYLFLDRGLRLEILTAHGAMLGIPDELEFYGLELFGVNYQALKILLALTMVLLLIFVVVQYAISAKCLLKQDVECAEAAAELLKQRGISHTEIAVRAGFKNIKECRRVYKAHFHKEFGRNK